MTYFITTMDRIQAETFALYVIMPVLLTYMFVV